MPDYSTNDPKGWCGDPKRGAAMGRPQVQDEPEGYTGKVYLRKVRLDAGGYDRNGTYFGAGGGLYWCCSAENSIDFMVRAWSRADAKRKVHAVYPKVRFFR